MMQQATLALILFIIATSGAFAAKLKPLGVFGSWSAWTHFDKGHDRCFIYSTPQAKEPSSLNHGLVTFFVRTTRHGARSEASFQTGYDFAPRSPIRVTIGNRTFRMATAGNSAWLRSSKREREFLAALEGGHSMALQATSSRGNKTMYRFALDGLTRAMQRARRACP